MIRQPAPSEAKSRGATWKIIIAINLVLGGFLYFIVLTNNSLPGDKPNFIYAFVVGIISFISLLLPIKKSCPNRWTRRFYTLSCLPSLVVGGIACLGIPFLALYLLAVECKEIQRIASPDHTRVAVVYNVRGDGGACASGFRITIISVRHHLLPFIERRVVASDYARANPTTGEYVRWKDNDTLLIEEPEVITNAQGKLQFSRQYLQRELKIPPIEWKLRFKETNAQTPATKAAGSQPRHNVKQTIRQPGS